MNKLALTTIYMLLGGYMAIFAGNLPINIAHRGACAYLPEHTLPAKALAYGMQADYIEQDVVLTKDDRALVIHDIHLDTVTDVAEKFPGRARADGRYYALDFTLAEIRTLKACERFNIASGTAVFAGRFPLWKSDFRLHTLEEEIELIQGLNHSTGRNVGIYPEIKDPAWHREQGHDISPIVIRILADYGYTKAEDKVYLQCFDFAELKRVKSELKCELKLIQLTEEDFDVASVASYAVGIGPWIKQLISGFDKDGRPIISDLAAQAKAHGLEMHPYTFRVDALPDGISAEKLLDTLFNEIGVDGIFSDFPDVSRDFIRTRVKAR
ncbi:MAG: glycerophosphodiester phosphodiesterase [Candidatus Riflebacteria bacterium HGW-Riflebacteria-2]|jgi:glycerophosphoryl diester phosphodiesterase|nr:MAG: glycerophosphodiester phosphodiesterase [Candidatus Riflebacteria bacterium HGW-Riflebacteria-2]